MNPNEEKIVVETKGDPVIKLIEPTGEESKGTLNEITTSVRELAQKLPESIGKLPGSIGAAIQNAISAREHSVSVHVDDETIRALDQLVQTGIFDSRNEAAAFLLNEGLKFRQELFVQISTKVHQIEQLRAELKSIVNP